jgi:hypothetical protein
MADPAFWAATSSIATVALLVVTAAYALITYWLLQAAREQSWESSRPRLVVAAQTNQGGQFMLLHIENVGVSTAYNLRLSIDRPVHRMIGDKRDLRDVPMFANGLRALPPHTPSRFGLAGSHQYLADEVDRDKHPLSFLIEANYDHNGRSIREEFPIDIENQYSLSSIERDHLDEFGKKFPDQFERAIGSLTRAIEGQDR